MSADINRLCLECMSYSLGDDGICSRCGADANRPPELPHHLTPRTVLNGKYLAARVLGEGGFGITYLGWDINLEIKVAIKEYYPFGSVTRNTTYDDTVTALAGSTMDFFNQGRERFIEEARRLAKFQNLPGIVSVKDFFYENGTAYIVMEFVEGGTMKDYLDRSGGRMPEETVLELMRPLVKSLAEVHRTGLIHRDISPDNIMITPEGQLRLIDFGAARDFGSDGKSLSVLLKPGYAPEEQYRSQGNQGPWTDVYALAATIFRAIDGTKPPESMERMFDDEFRGFHVPVSASTAAAVTKGLALRAPDRWQSMDEFYSALYGAPAIAAAGATMRAAPSENFRPVAPSVPPAPPARPAKPASGSGKKSPAPFIAIGVGVVVIAAVLAMVLGGDDEKPTPPTDAQIAHVETDRPIETTAPTIAPTPKPTPTPAPTPEPTPVYAFSEYAQTASASSVLPTEYGFTYNASNVFGNDDNSPWCEGVTGNGIGEWLQLETKNGETATLSMISIKNGNQRSDSTYGINNRVKELTIEYSGGSSSWILEDTADWQTLTFYEPVETSYVRIIIESVYSGTKYQDTCIARVWCG